MQVTPETFFVHDNSKPIIENSGVNVIYFTNKCNLACTYCYEDLADRPPQILTKEDIRRTIDEILARENPNEQTLFVMFGGEVTLEWENAKYFMEYAYSKKENVHFNIESNGIKFLKDSFLKDYKNLKYNKLGLISLDISFDGIGNGERVTHNGKSSTPLMLKIFNRLNKTSIPFRLRYTIQSSNINNLHNDITLLAKTFTPLRIITSVAWSNLSTSDIQLLDEHKESLRKDWIDGDLNIPVCELFCDMCNGCDNRKELKTYFTDEGNVTTYKNHESIPEFHDFKDKET